MSQLGSPVARVVKTRQFQDPKLAERQGDRIEQEWYLGNPKLNIGYAAPGSQFTESQGQNKPNERPEEPYVS